MTDTRDPIHVQTYRDADAAFPMAQALWKEVGITPPPEVLQATMATLLIHMKDLRKSGGTSSPQAARAVPAAQATGRAAPSPAVTETAAACPVCGGAMWDNRENKKNPKAPDFKCKDKSCEGVIWPPKRGPGKPAAAPRPVPTVANGGFNEKPEALDDDDDLPF